MNISDFVLNWILIEQYFVPIQWKNEFSKRIGLGYPQPTHTSFSSHIYLRHPLYTTMISSPSTSKQTGMIDVPPTTHSNHIREALLTELFPPLWVPPQVSPKLDETDNLAEYKQWAEHKCKELSQALKLGATNLEPTSHVRHENALFCPISEQCKAPPSPSK